MQLGETQKSASDAPEMAEKMKLPNRSPAGPGGSHKGLGTATSVGQ